MNSYALSIETLQQDEDFRNTLSVCVLEETPRLLSLRVLLFRQHSCHKRYELLERLEVRCLVRHQMLNPPYELALYDPRSGVNLHDEGSSNRQGRLILGHESIHTYRHRRSNTGHLPDKNSILRDGSVIDKVFRLSFRFQFKF